MKIPWWTLTRLPLTPTHPGYMEQCHYSPLPPEHPELLELFDPLLANSKDSSQMTLTVQDWDRYGKISWKKILCLQSVIQMPLHFYLLPFSTSSGNSRDEPFNKEVTVLLLLGVCCIKATFVWCGYSQISVSCLLTLRSHTLHIPRYLQMVNWLWSFCKSALKQQQLP